MQHKSGAIDPELKAKIDEIHACLDRYWGTVLWGWYLYVKINELAKRI